MAKLKDKLESKVLPIVMFTLFIDLLGVGILIPVVPQLLANPHSGFYLLPAGWSYKSGLILLGWLTAIYPFMQFVATPILGQLSDRYGRKKILAISLAGTAVSYAVFAIGIIQRNIPLLFVSRAFDGITGGNMAVAQAAVADVTVPERRTRNFGMMGAIFGIGFVLGPYIGGKLSTGGVTLLHVGGLKAFTTPSWFNAATPFWFAAVLCVINVALVLTILPETLKTFAKSAALKWNQSIKNITKAFANPQLRNIFIMVFLFYGAFTIFNTFFGVYAASKFGFRANNLGDFFAYVGLWIAFAQGITGPLAKRFANWQILRFTVLGAAAAVPLMLIPHNTSGLLLLSPPYMLFVGITIANITALVSRSVGGDKQGEILGVTASVQALAQAIPAAVTGYIGTISRNMPLIVSSVVFGLGGVLFILFYRPSSRAKKPAAIEPVAAA